MTLEALTPDVIPLFGTVPRFAGSSTSTAKLKKSILNRPRGLLTAKGEKGEIVDGKGKPCMWWGEPQWEPQKEAHDTGLRMSRTVRQTPQYGLGQ